MKITVITGSPHKDGTSNVLRDEFIKGITKSGHEVFVFNSAFEKINPCLGCDYCLSHSSNCVHKDLSNEINKRLLDSDMVVFITPLYYFGMSAQLKTVIDRFYAINSKLMNKSIKSMLFATSADNKDWTMNALVDHYDTLVKYLNMEDKGIIFAKGCYIKEDIINSEFPKQAYELGVNLK